jgi:2'-5' RNA ligase
MSEANNQAGPDSAHLGELARFRNIRLLHNHWSRPIGPRSYYWYLTFEDSAELHHLAAECQEAIAFPYYDLTPLRDLHLTLDRIAFEDRITSSQLTGVEAAATRACQKIQPFDITIGTLGGTPGAIGLTAFPAPPLQELRDTFRAATLSAYPDAPVGRSGFHPHVTIAYANSDGVPATEVVASVEKLNALPDVSVTIKEGTLAFLERRQRAYSWRAVSRIPLAGGG